MGTTTTTVPPPPAPRYLPPMRAGEIDGRYMNCSPDLTPFGDTFVDVGSLTFAISRYDGQPMTSSDLQSAGADWPDTLDSTKLIPTVGLLAPAGAAGVTYWITQTADKTTQGRLFIRDWLIEVVPRMG